MIAYLDNAATTRVWPEAAQAALQAAVAFLPESRHTPTLWKALPL